MELISFLLNGQRQEIQADPHRTLLDVLREDLDLTGTKRGCDGGECGSCTVLLDGKAVLSCQLPMAKVKGRQITTIEALATPEQLHPLQRAFIEKGAVQCGFCTPGMIMRAKSLLDSDPNPSREDVIRRLSRNLCRCTGYVKIVDAILFAASLTHEGSGEEQPLKLDHVVGTSPERLDYRDKVTGRAKYAADLKMPGVLHAKLLRSPHPHALIKTVETSAAREVAGVQAVFTAQDFPPLPVTPRRRMARPLLVRDKVCFVGEAVAAVVATSEETAAKALDKIQVNYEVLEPTLDPLRALNKESPPIHEGESNLDFLQRIVRGDAARSFAEADVVIENTYVTPHQAHAYLEPEAALAYVDEGGCLTVRTCTQSPHADRDTLAKLLGLTEEQVRVIPTFLGGGFGGKIGGICSIITGIIAYKMGKPVKMVLTRKESLLSSHKRYPFSFRLRTGASRQGKLTALKADVVGIQGAYAIGRHGVTVPWRVAVCVAGPYEIPHVQIETKTALTNVMPSGAFRGYGSMQTAFAIESQMDILAERLGIDPLELRLRNAVGLGSTTITGHVLDESVGVKKTLEAIRPYYEEAKRWAREPSLGGNFKRGVGIAVGVKPFGTGLEPVQAFVELLANGTVRILTGTVELGQGAWTVLPQIAAEELGLPLQTISLVGGDTALTPPHITAGQKATYYGGNAVRLAAAELKKAIMGVASEILEESEDQLTIESDCVCSSKSEHQVSLARIAAIMQGKGLPLRYKGAYQQRIFVDLDENGQGVPGTIYLYNTQMAQVEVNTTSGTVRVPRMVYAGDVGRIVHPLSFTGQVEGGTLISLGFALKEKFIPGESESFKTYKIPTTRDTPEVITVFMEDLVPSGPFGAKGGGEVTAVPGAAAILNAIANAIGVRIFELPATPERILSALKGEKNKSASLG